ncbi:Hypothetical protein SMAX5B_013807 [Scophthalmus maximus]|uniref:Uncharacterized protein n=1 Tax=Scophthalmus maximus TaxID=52904 RepID=A0A2U9CII1_SCOMX|nr:Hypothetical protein SMAX5B_013807 [Scophthalmus maximus]
MRKRRTIEQAHSYCLVEQIRCRSGGGGDQGTQSERASELRAVRAAADGLLDGLLDGVSADIFTATRRWTRQQRSGRPVSHYRIEKCDWDRRQLHSSRPGPHPTSLECT